MPAPDQTCPTWTRPRARRRVDDVELLRWIDEFVAINRYAPSLREVGAACGYSSPSSTAARLNRLRREGFVDWNECETRTLRTTRRSL
jgi:SOS-response transcriptional repressor LexA